MNIYLNKLKKYIKSLKLNHNDPTRNPSCSQFEVDNYVISEFIIKKLYPITSSHPFPLVELNLMVSAVCYLKPEQIFEWGTNIGKSSRIFYEVSKFFSLPMHIHTVDLPDDVEHGEHPHSNRGHMIKGLKNISLYQADGLSKSIELYHQNSQKRTLVFIDGDHSYESVYRELTGIINAMPNAAILLHDTFYQSEQSGYNIGPYKAITEILATMPGTFQVMSTTTGLPGMTLLYKK
jgi:hypothetical protein